MLDHPVPVGSSGSGSGLLGEWLRTQFSGSPVVLYEDVVSGRGWW